MKKRRLTALGAIVALLVVAILLLALIFAGWLFVKQPAKVEEPQLPVQMEEQAPAAQAQEQATPEPVEEQAPPPIQEEEPEVVPSPSSQTELTAPEPEVTLPEADPEVMETAPSLPEGKQEGEEATANEPQQESATPLILPDLPRTPATMNDEEKQAAIEATAQDALHVARASGQSEAAAMQASDEARQQARRIFYRTNAVN